MKPKALLGYATFPNEETAIRISRLLVSEGLIACANIFPPHTSIYGWNGSLQQERECAVIFKTTATKTVRLGERIRAIHPYRIPALVFLPIETGLPDFLQWIHSQTL